MSKGENNRRLEINTIQKSFMYFMALEMRKNHVIETSQYGKVLEFIDFLEYVEEAGMREIKKLIEEGSSHPTAEKGGV